MTVLSWQDSCSNSIHIFCISSSRNCLRRAARERYKWVLCTNFPCEDLDNWLSRVVFCLQFFVLRELDHSFMHPVDRWCDNSRADIIIYGHLWNSAISNWRSTSSNCGSVGANFFDVYVHVPLCQRPDGIGIRAFLSLGGVVCVSLTLMFKIKSFFSVNYVN